MSNFTTKDLRSDDLKAINEFASLCKGVDPRIALLAMDAFKAGIVSRYYFAGKKFGWLRKERS